MLMADNEEVKVTLPIEGQPLETEPPKKDEAVADLAKQYAELEARGKAREERLEIERRQRQQAEEAVVHARAETEKARTQVADSEFDRISQGLSAAEAEAEGAATEYGRAMESGDFAAAGKAQRKMANAESRTVLLTERKNYIEARRLEQSQQEQPRQVQQQADPVEVYIGNRSEPTANWLRNHRDWITDQKKNVKLTAAHWRALDEGLTPDTPEYFEHVETTIGLRTRAEEPKTNGGTEPARSRRQTVPVAPVTQSSSSVSGGGTEVRLTPGEASAATDGTHLWGAHDLKAGRIKDKALVGQPIGHQEMARRKLALQKEGHYDRAYTES